ncbi:hypothetical protein Agabi119p4_6535 [Agaricus bisporus var. burnettii]|uniref:COP9 signalosome complex subunit 3 n=1 Tax=Agaricus bisporus var. burnettii TaxID=192524 RepID=A0A8H7C9I3_AGABI|nr:hypothetical protein Agabi119p4_6535 [Agaricus bisporus var. burnettii]
MDHLDLETLIARITSTPNSRTLNDYFRSIPADTREVILASTLPSGQDPLSVLDVRTNTLGVVYILSARVTVHGAVPPPWQVVDSFCHNFDREQARYAPERVVILGKNLTRLALHYNNPVASILPLRALIQRYVPDPSYLTSMHPQFLLICVCHRRFSDALPFLNHPITNIDTTDMHYTDNLIYHYVGGIALAALKQWSNAEEFFEICVTSPGLTPSAIQFEALKKMRLVQLISKGKMCPLPKYVLPGLSRMFKDSPYSSFVNAYPHDIELLREIGKKEKGVFAADKNMGLIHQAIDRAPRWALKKLIGTYITLNLADIAREVKIDSVDQVREMLLNMIESNEVSAQISASGTVTFSDPPPTFTQSQIDQLLRVAQMQSSRLNRLDMDYGRSREYLAKAVKYDGGSGGGLGRGGGMEEDMFMNTGPFAGASQLDTYGGGPHASQTVWGEESMFGS